MRFLLLVIFLAACLIGYAAGKLVPQPAEGCPQNTPTWSKTTPLAPDLSNDGGSGESTARLVLYPSQIELFTPYSPIRVWLLWEGLAITWVDRFPIVLNLPEGTYTLVVSHQFGVDVVPLRVGHPPLDEFAFN